MMTQWMPRTTSHRLTSGAPADVRGWHRGKLAAPNRQLALAAAVAAAAAPEWAKWYGVWLSLLSTPLISLPLFPQAPPYGQGQHPPAGACPLLCVRVCWVVLGSELGGAAQLGLSCQQFGEAALSEHGSSTYLSWQRWGCLRDADTRGMALPGGTAWGCSVAPGRCHVLVCV